MSDKGQLTTPEIAFWLAEAESCLERQKRELIERNNYPFLVNYYEGVQESGTIYPQVAAQAKYLIISEYFPSTNALISEIMYQNPDIMLEAMSPDTEGKVPLMKAGLKYFMDRSDALIENRVALFDMLYAGYCAVEIDQLPPEAKAESAPVEELEERSIFEKIADKIKGIDNEKEAEAAFAKLAPPIEANFSTVQGTYIRRYDPLDVPLDWRAERIRDRRYNLKKVWLSKAEFDAKYPAFKERVNVTEDKFEYAKHNLQIHNRKVLLYEFQAKLKNDVYRTIVVSTHIKTSEIDFFDRPYKATGFNMKIGTLHKYGKLYPVSFAQINKKMADEMNHYVRHLMDVAERNIPKYVYDKNKVKEDALSALQNTKVNDMAGIDGNTAGAVTPLQPSGASLENKELLTIFQDQKNKGWSVNESKIGGKSDAQFATEIAIEDKAFEARNIDVQEGLRCLLVEEMDMAKDLIMTFWDGPIFLKMTGQEISWYTPNVVPNPNDPSSDMVLNPLTDEVLGDYMVKIDIASSVRKNQQQLLAGMMAYLDKLMAYRQVLIEQGMDINIDEIRKMSKEFGLDPEKIFVQHQPAMVPTVPTAAGEMISPEEDARRQQEAEMRIQQQGGAK